MREQAHTNDTPRRSDWNRSGPLMKRGYQGVYHWMSEKHLHRYVVEFEGRHNDRPLDTIDQMTAIVQRIQGFVHTRTETTATVQSPPSVHRPGRAC